MLLASNSGQGTVHVSEWQNEGNAVTVRISAGGETKVEVDDAHGARVASIPAEHINFPNSFSGIDRPMWYR